jgi:hypothetical protein
MYVLALSVELHVPHARSLKARRAAIKPIVEGCKHRFGAAAAETDHQDVWQRAGLGVAVVSATPHHAGERMDEIERWIWSRPDVEVVRCDRHWLDTDE